MLSIDEAIEQFKYDAECNRADLDLSYAEDNEQVAEWLEELKTYREEKCNKSVYLANKSIDMIDAVNKGYAYGYNKAIDDFADKLNAKCDGMIKEKWNSNVSPISWAEAYADFKDDIDEIAEQLKEGGENE